MSLVNSEYVWILCTLLALIELRSGQQRLVTSLLGRRDSITWHSCHIFGPITFKYTRRSAPFGRLSARNKKFGKIFSNFFFRFFSSWNVDYTFIVSSKSVHPFQSYSCDKQTTDRQTFVIIILGCTLHFCNSQNVLSFAKPVIFYSKRLPNAYYA